MFDTGNTGFMLVATSLVMLMTPGLAFFYGGLVGRRNVLSIMMQSFVSLGVTTVLWYCVGFSLCFSGGAGGVIGNLDMAFLKGITPATPFGDGQIPMLVFVAYQMMFAIITPALITGAFSNRVRFPAYLIFLVMWLLLHVTRLMRVMKRAADRPVGQVDSAVMLNARLQPGLNLMQVIALTRALGERLGVEDEEPERWRWTDTGGSSVTVRLTGGRVTGWDLHRPAPES